MFFLLIMVISAIGLLVGLAMFLLGIYLLWHKSPYIIFKFTVLILGTTMMTLSSHFLFNAIA